jgi:hypothetical protein
MILARQLITAKLNVAVGTDPAPAEETIVHADNLLRGFFGKLPYGIKPKSMPGQAMTTDARTLEDYNLGNLTPDCIP